MSEVRQLRLVVEAVDFDEAVRFYRDVLGMPEIAAFAETGEDRVAILDAGRATLEIGNQTHKRAVDDLEAGGTPSPRIRVALQVDDAASVTQAAADAGAAVIAPPVETPWRSLNSRLAAPADLVVTLFEDLDDEEHWVSATQPEK